MDKKELVKQKLGFWKKKIDSALRSYWKKSGQLAIHKNRWIKQSWQKAERVVASGGKRLRPALMLLTYELSGRKEAKKIMPVALALELLHNYFLVHDDVIDKDPLRHGTTTLNEVYRQAAINFGRNLPESAHFGNSIALLLGDRLAAEAFQLIIRSDILAEKKMPVLNEILTMVNTTICGEQLDVMVSFPASSGLNSTRKTVEEVIKNKTAYYTFVAPIRIGGLLGGLTKKDLAVMEQIGYQLGEIFQWQDDYLGIFAEEKALGKPAGSDLREKKPTLLLLKSYEKLTIQDRIKLRNLMGRNLSDAELMKARGLIKKSGADKWLLDKINDSLKKLEELIQLSELSSASKNIFIGLTNLLIDRKY
jgi:geranylgeranyl diphosphate synthase type II